MFKINYKILFGSQKQYRITAIESLKIFESVESIISTAEITLPKRPKDGFINAGDDMQIWLWYNNDKQIKAFEGYIKEFSDNGGNYTIFCENSVYKLRNVTVENESYNKISCKELLDKIASKSGLTVDCDYDFEYDKFTIQNASAYQILRQIKDDTPSHIYIKDGCLHMHAPYIKNFGTAIYDTAINIDKDGFDVKFLAKTQRKTRIIYKGKDKDGKQIQSDVKGSPDGNIITVDFKGVTTKEALNKMAQEMANTKQFDGIEGSFQTWLYHLYIQNRHFFLKNILSIMRIYCIFANKTTIHYGQEM